MADNLIRSNGDVLEVDVGSNTVNQGDPILVGTITGVAQGDKNSDNKVVMLTEGVHNLSVSANDTGGAGTAVNNGDKVYLDDIGGDLRPDSSHGELMGQVWDKTVANDGEVIPSGNTNTVPVRLIQ